MLSWLVSTSMRLRVVLVVSCVVLLVAGYRTIRDAPLDVFPEFSPPIIEIQTEAPGLSSEQVESLITIPLENVLNGMPHATSIPQDYPATLDSLSFKPDEMRRLYDLGFCHGMASHSWRKTPPGTEATEQFVPRSGTDFLAPVVIDSLPAQRR